MLLPADRRVVSHRRFCAECKRSYAERRLAREQELAQTALMLGLSNPQWRETFTDALPGQYELMLLHAAAHHPQYDGPAGEAVSFEALRDYLDETMDRVREAAGKESPRESAGTFAAGSRTPGCGYACVACTVA